MRNSRVLVSLVSLLALPWPTSSHGGHHHDHFAPERELTEAALYSRASWDHRRRLDPANGDSPPHQPFCNVKMNEKEREIMGLVSAEFESQRRLSNRELAPGDTIIPVYFHVFKPNATYGDLDPIDADFFIATLNFGFGGTGFQFQLIDTTITINKDWYFCNDIRYPFLKKATRQGGPETLNMWFCDLDEVDTVGFSLFPPAYLYSKFSDGIVMRNPSLEQSNATQPDSDLGNFFVSSWEERTLIFNAAIHEVGHWMGLAHTFEAECDNQTYGLYKYFPDYFFVNDGVKDTAAHMQPVITSKDVYVCGNQKNPPSDTCPNNNPMVDPGADPWDNYMNYLSGYCFENYGRFTDGQIVRMKAQYDMFRGPTRTTTKAPSPAPRPSASPAPTELINYKKAATTCLKQAYTNPCKQKLTTGDGSDGTKKLAVIVKACAESDGIPNENKLKSKALSQLKQLCKSKRKRRRQK